MAGALGRAADLARRVRYSTANEGAVRVVVQTIHRLTNVRPERTRAFDRVHGTDTAGRRTIATLDGFSPERRAEALDYTPSPPKVTRWMLRHAGVRPEDATFVDLGCGKGRVLLVAAELPFRRVLGVDLAPELVAVATRNIEGARGRRRCSSVEAEVADAGAFDVPDGDLLVHLYHPFAPTVLAQVLDRLGAARASGGPRRITVAYLLYTGAVDDVRAAFAGAAWLREVRYEASLWGEYDWLLYRG